MVGLALALAFGIAARLAWPGDIEFKLDEAWTFDRALRVAAGDWSWTGMPSSIGIPNPGASDWLFGALAALSGATSPPDLARAVQTMNVAAIVGLLAFALRAVDPGTRAPWLWALALWSVNPLAVLFERKIWPPSVLPLFTVALIAGWWHRGTAWGAVLWAASGAALLQIHPPSGLLAFAVAAWTAMADRRSARWRVWLATTAIAALPLVPWVAALPGVAATASDESWGGLAPAFYLRWLAQPFGLGAEYTLGRSGFRAFLAGPAVWGQDSYAIAALHLVAAASALALGVRALRALAAAPRDLRAVFIGRGPTILVAAACWGYGGILTLLTLSPMRSHRHYLAAIPMILALWVAALARLGGGGSIDPPARRLLAVCCLAQAGITGGLLLYIHDIQAVGADFGTTWRAQQERVGPRPQDNGAQPLIHFRR